MSDRTHTCTSGGRNWIYLISFLTLHPRSLLGETRIKYGGLNVIDPQFSSSDVLSSGASRVRRQSRIQSLLTEAEKAESVLIHNQLRRMEAASDMEFMVCTGIARVHCPPIPIAVLNQSRTHVGAVETPNTLPLIR